MSNYFFSCQIGILEQSFLLLALYSRYAATVTGRMLREGEKNIDLKLSKLTSDQTNYCWF